MIYRKYYIDILRMAQSGYNVSFISLVYCHSKLQRFN